MSFKLVIECSSDITEINIKFSSSNKEVVIGTTPVTDTSVMSQASFDDILERRASEAKSAEPVPVIVPKVVVPDVTGRVSAINGDMSQSY